MKKLIDELGQIEQYHLLYPARGAKGPGRVATVLSKQSIPRHSVRRSVASLAVSSRYCSRAASTRPSASASFSASPTVPATHAPLVNTNTGCPPSIPK